MESEPKRQAKHRAAAAQEGKLSAAAQASPHRVVNYLADRRFVHASGAQQMGVKQTLVINTMEADGVIGRYAISGAVAAYNYIEPTVTDDLDILVSFKRIREERMQIENPPR
jgi:hypothetical protein